MNKYVEEFLLKIFDAGIRENRTVTMSLSKIGDEEWVSITVLNPDKQDTEDA